MTRAIFTPITDSQHIEEVCRLAAQIWKEHYTPIIGIEQVEYMLEKFQSPAAVKKQLQEQYKYYFITAGQGRAGYIAVKEEADKLFLSKFYISKPYRKQGLAGQSMRFLEEQCGGQGLRSIWLTVNKYNEDSIAVYERLGFTKVREAVADIGNGFVMDDYVMEKSILV